MNVVLDAGALIAIDRDSPLIESALRLARRSGAQLLTVAPVVTQVWRHGSRQANLARALSAIDVRVVDYQMAKRAGELLGSSNTADAVDALISLLVGPGDQVFTSDPDDIATLLEARGIPAQIVRI